MQKFIILTYYHVPKI